MYIENNYNEYTDNDNDRFKGYNWAYNKYAKYD